MSTHAEGRLKRRFTDTGEVELVIVDDRGKVSEEKHFDFDEAKDAICWYENFNCDVFF